MRRIIKERKDLQFVVIYTREPHARQMAFKKIAQPVTWEERQTLAKKTKEELNLDALFLVDDIGDPSRKLLGDLPNPGIFVERDGTIKDKLSWAEPWVVLKVIEKWTPQPAQTPSDETAPKLLGTPLSEPVKKSVTPTRQDTEAKHPAG